MDQRPKLSIVNYRKGMYVVLEGTHNIERFYIVQSGKVIVSHAGSLDSSFESQNSLGSGDFFGVVSTMAQKSQIETAQAITDVALVAVGRDMFEGLIRFNTPIAMKIIQQFSRKMRFLNNELAHINLQFREETDSQKILFSLGEYYVDKGKFGMAPYAFRRYSECYPLGEHLAEAEKRIAELLPHKKPDFTDNCSAFVRRYVADSPVFLEGEPGEELFIIQSGSVKITKLLNNDTVILAILKTGDIFGEMAILESEPRSASAITFESTTLMVIQKENFENMAAEHPQVISRLTQLLAERIWFGYKQLENAGILNPVLRCIDYLVTKLERINFAMKPHTPYTFDFGLEELARMVLIPEVEMRDVIRQLRQHDKIKVLADGRVNIPDVAEIKAMSESYKKVNNRRRSMEAT